MRTGVSLMQELRVSSVDEIPFRGASEEDRAREAEVRRQLGPRIGRPEHETLDDGLRVTMWLVSESRLRRRVTDVRRGSARVDDVCELPVHPGKMWGTVGGRMVPVG